MLQKYNYFLIRFKKIKNNKKKGHPLRRVLLTEFKYNITI